MSQQQVDPHVFVIIGATGDLTRRKLLPALYHLRDQGVLETRNTLIVGAALPELGEDGFRLWVHEGLHKAGWHNDHELRAWCDACLYYHTIGRGTDEDYAALASYIRNIEQQHVMPENRVFYLAVPPDIAPAAIEGLDRAGLLKGRGWVRVVFEKPFGHDFQSARHLNTTLHQYVDESQIYRIDHYLGKETVQNLLAFRFANPIFESLWKRDAIENVQITVAEDLGVEHRGAYYQQSGALRDMVQNHLTQLMTVVAMEVPVSFDAAAIQSEKLKVLHSIAPIAERDVVFGQYTSWQVGGQTIPGYREEPGVSGVGLGSERLDQPDAPVLGALLQRPAQLPVGLPPLRLGLGVDQVREPRREEVDDRQGQVGGRRLVHPAIPVEDRLLVREALHPPARERAEAHVGAELLTRDDDVRLRAVGVRTDHRQDRAVLPAGNRRNGDGPRGEVRGLVHGSGRLAQSTHSRIAISALSPRRGPSLTIRV